ncbi:MAG: Fe-S oxidoreductase [Gammaproteobacteria bacterium]|nr:Fe-S oxidoreductase [Gammaproteobacteria bacterium]
MSTTLTEGQREGSLEAPKRHPLHWDKPEFYDEPALIQELERVFDICHGCRRCFSLCNSFPTLFDAIDASETLELDGVDRKVFWDVVDHCYLCDMCYMTKCPYVPPHPWNLDFPHLMLRAKAVKFKKGEFRARDKLLTSTDAVGNLAGIPVIAQAVNAANRNTTVRRLMDKVIGVHPEAHLPEYHSDSLRKRDKRRERPALQPVATAETKGRVVLFTTCYGNRNEPQIGEDLIAIFEHNGIPVVLMEDERCCGMPKLELGDLEAVQRAKEFNIPRLARWVEEGWDIVGPVPSCVLMLKQEYPLLFPDDEQVRMVSRATYDPFEYLMLRHKEGRLKTDFKQPLGKVAYHTACHLRVQNIGYKTRDLLQLVPQTSVEVIERCSGHDGTYGVKSETFAIAAKICRPVVNKVKGAGADHYTSDCPIAGHHIGNGLRDGSDATHPLTLLRTAYEI